MEIKTQSIEHIHSDRNVLDQFSDHFLSSLKPITQRAYRNDLGAFSDFLGMPDVSTMSEAFIKLFHGEANLKVIKWRTYLKEIGMSPASINRKLAAVRSLTSFARMLGLINWKLEVKNLKSTPYKNVRGPGQSAYERMLDHLDSKSTKQSIRDKAILVLFHDLGLRRAELSAINYEDLSIGEVVSIAIQGKGRDYKENLTVPLKTFNSIKNWIDIRGRHSGPLFTSFDRAKKGSGRLTPNALYERIKALGKAVGIETHPHALRHLAITEACKLAQNNGFGLEEVLDFSRHANVSTLMIYRDKERDIQGILSELLSKRKKIT